MRVTPRAHHPVRETVIIRLASNQPQLDEQLDSQQRKRTQVYVRVRLASLVERRRRLVGDDHRVIGGVVDHGTAAHQLLLVAF